MSTVASTDNVRTWCDAVDACVADIQRAADGDDWERAGMLCSRLDQTLREAPPPDADSDAVATSVRGAQAALARLDEQARATRAALGEELRQVNRGRKAVSAYR